MNKNKHWFLVSVTLLFLIIAFVSFRVIFTNYRTGPNSESLPTNSPSASFKQSEPPNSIFFYGVNVEMSQLLPGSKKYIVNDKGEDLIDIAAKLGINLFRLTHGTPPFINNPAPTFTKEQWDMVLNKMHQTGIQAIILIESPSIYQKNIPSAYLDFVQSYVLNSDVLTHPAVYGVDLYNEPLLTDANVAAMQTAAQMIKAEYPHSQLTVGWWATATGNTDDDGREIYNWDDYAAGRVFEDFTDFYSLHLYGFDDNTSFFHKFPDPQSLTRKYISQVKKQLQTDKPLLIGEFGAANGDAISDQDTIGSQELQANTYAAVYQTLTELNDPQLIGTAAFQFYSRHVGPDAWALLKDKGNFLYPAAYMLQKYATGKSDIPLSLPLQPVPDNLLLTNRQNGQELKIKPLDIVGLNLSLDPNSDYSASLSDESLFLANQPLTYDSVADKHQAVFQALQPGNTDLTVWECRNSECTERNDVFTVSFSIK